MEKEYLSEKKYQDVKKGLLVLGVIVLVAAIAVSYIFLLGPGFEKRKDANSYPIPSEEEVQTQLTAIEEKYSELEDELEAKYDTLEKEIEDKYSKDMTEEGFYEEQVTEMKEISDLDKERIDESADLTSKQFSEIQDAESSISSSEFEKKKLEIEATRNLSFGAVAILAGMIIAGWLFLGAFGRNILAFGTQTSMPIQQEHMKKMAPTYGEVGGQVAKEITKGVKEGLKE